MAIIRGVDAVRARREAMGTAFEVALYGDDPAYLRDAARMALDEVELLDEQFSVFNEGSELSGINAEAARRPVRVEPQLFDLLSLCQRLHRLTDGAFDVTVGPLLALWRDAAREGRMPSAAALAEARRRVGMQHVTLRSKTRHVAFDREGVALDLGGIGKGYAVDAIVESLRRVGVRSALVHVGTSSVFALGAPPGEQAWEVGIAHPLDREKRLLTLTLRDRAASTSGGYEQFVIISGQRYCHIIDPRTGRPVAGMLSCTVLTPRATEGDALSTALFVLGVEGARRYCASHREVEAILVPTPAPGQDAQPVRVGGTTGAEK
ncbi:MAG: FAD:protein FMN transferase [Planctomycetota bacterium]